MNLETKTGWRTPRKHLDGDLETTPEVPGGIRTKAVPQGSGQSFGLSLLCLLFDSRAGRTL